MSPRPHILACLPIYPIVAGIIAAGLIESRKAPTTADGVPLQPLPLVTTHRCNAVSPTVSPTASSPTEQSLGT